MFDIDTGSSGSGSSGPWINWHSKESNDGAIPGRSFRLRDTEGRKVFKGFESGVIFDIDNMKLGWNHSTGAPGAAPEWQWNPTLSQFAPQPSPEWKRGFSIPIATQRGNTAVWEQAAAGAFIGFENLVPQLRNREGSKLPMVKVDGYETIQGKRGSFNVPKLVVSGWVDRPDALKTSIATEPVAAAPAQEAPVQQAQSFADDEF